MKPFPFQVILLVLSTIIFVNCSNNAPKKIEKTQIKIEGSFSEQLYKNSFSSYEFAKNLKSNKLKFISDLENDPYKFRDYRIDLNISAANIGVYITDAQYLRAYGDKNRAQLSSKSAQRLFQLIETQELDTSLLQIQKGYQDSDSALFALNDALKDSVNNLSDKDRKRYLLSLTAGIFIERNYYLLHLLKNQSNYESANVSKIFYLLKEHNNQLSNLFAISNKYRNNEYNNYLKADLKNFNSYYLENVSLFEIGESHRERKIFINTLLAKITEMRNFIIYADLLITKA